MNINIEKLYELAEIGGPVVVMLIFISLVAMTIAIAKVIQLLIVETTYKSNCEQALQLWNQNKKIDAINRLANSKNPVCQIMNASLKGMTYRQLRYENVTNELTRVAKQKLNKLRSQLKTLEIIASLSPLLGLLGTVLGMIEAFQQLQTAGTQVDPSILSGGIWEALLTTAVGLCVAIPALIAYTWCDRKVENIRLIMEDYVTKVLASDAHKVMSFIPPNKNLTVTTNNSVTNTI